MTKAVDELLDVLDFLLLVSIGLRLLLEAGFALIQVGAVVASVGIELSGIWVYFHDGLDHRVHEVAVVGNHQDGTAVV